jgi:hypothetical protein
MVTAQQEPNDGPGGGGGEGEGPGGEGGGGPENNQGSDAPTPSQPGSDIPTPSQEGSSDKPSDVVSSIDPITTIPTSPSIPAVPSAEGGGNQPAEPTFAPSTTVIARGVPSVGSDATALLFQNDMSWMICTGVAAATLFGLTLN